MSEWLSLLLIVVACFGLGWLVVRQFAGSARPALPLAFAALAIGVIVTGWLALVLAEFRLYTLSGLGVLWLLLVAALIAADVWRRRSGRWPAAPASPQAAAAPLLPTLPAWSEGVFLGLWLVAALWLFFRPHEYVPGASDAGVYVSLSASIARSGGVLIEDDTLAGLDASLIPALLRPLPENPVAPHYLFPGFYVIGQPPGEITPQFYPLHPVWQAVAYALADATGGPLNAIRASLLMPGFWALLGGLAVYLTVRQSVGREAAALALTGLTVCALQVWFARYPTAETLTQFLLWGGLFAVGVWLGGEAPGKLWALLAGLCFGGVFLVRVDILVLLPVLGMLALFLLGSGRRVVGGPGEVAWFLVPLVFLVAHSFVHAYWQSRPYFVVHSGLGMQLLKVNWAIPLVGLAAAAAAIWLIWRAGPAFVQGYARYRRWALGALIAVTLIIAAYGWFIRPMTGEAILRQDLYSGQEIPLTDHENWLRLGWYLSPIGVWLGVAGVCVLIWRVNRRTAVILVVGALFSALYLWNLRANPHQVYAMRRFVPVTVPFFCLAAAVFIDWLARLPRPWARALAALAAVLWLGGLALSARGFISQVDHRGLAAQLVALDETLATDSVLLFNDQAVIGQGDFFGTPLQFMFGHDVFSLRDPSQLDPAVLVKAIEAWQNSGRAVYWVGDPAWLADRGLAYTETPVTLRSQHLEERYDRKPSAVLQDEWTLRISQIESN